MHQSDALLRLEFPEVLPFIVCPMLVRNSDLTLFFLSGYYAQTNLLYPISNNNGSIPTRARITNFPPSLALSSMSCKVNHYGLVRYVNPATEKESRN